MTRSGDQVSFTPATWLGVAAIGITVALTFGAAWQTMSNEIAILGTKMESMDDQFGEVKEDIRDLRSAVAR
tara:strand:+ start:476 stop:688 length:213 start_codon:yes stop_codon:yes gene_type:complete